MTSNDKIGPGEDQDLIPTRRSLLSRLKDWKDEESWKVFFDTYWKLIYHAALRAGLTESEAEDVVQETVFSVARNLPGFKYDPAKGSFKAWLLQLTKWRIVDQTRKRQGAAQAERPPERPGAPASQTSTSADAIEQIADPAQAVDALWENEWERNLMEAAIERVKRRVDAKQYQIFDCYVMKDWSISRVRHALRVNAGAVYIAKHRVTKMIKKEIASLRDEPIGNSRKNEKDTES